MACKKYIYTSNDFAQNLLQCVRICKPEFLCVC